MQGDFLRDAEIDLTLTWASLGGGGGGGGAAAV